MDDPFRQAKEDIDKLFDEAHEQVDELTKEPTRLERFLRWITE